MNIKKFRFVKTNADMSLPKFMHSLRGSLGNLVVVFDEIAPFVNLINLQPQTPGPTHPEAIFMTLNSGQGVTRSFMVNCFIFIYLFFFFLSMYVFIFSLFFFLIEHRKKEVMLQLIQLL